MNGHVTLTLDTFSFQRKPLGFGSREGESICFENIGPEQRRKRLFFGLFMFAVSTIFAVALIVAGVNHWWRLLLFFPFTTAGTGLFQALERT